MKVKKHAPRQPALWEGRVLVWFSCGASSAVAAKLALEKYGRERVQVLYCDTSEDEHEDNARFLKDVEKWLDIEIIKLKSPDFENIFDVFEATRFLASPQGAACTGMLKRTVGHAYRDVADINIYGFTADRRERERAATYNVNNFDQHLDFILIEAGLTKADCFEVLRAAGIKRSAMYDLGFENANCRGCVKVKSLNYWLKVRHYWPERFARYADVSRRLNYKMVRYQVKGETIYLHLDEIPHDALPDLSDATGESDVECGVLCSQGIAA